MKSSYKTIILYNTFFTAFRMLIGATSVVFLLQKGLPEDELLLLKMVQFVFVALLDIPLSHWTDNKSKKLSLILAALAGGIWLLLTALGSGTIFLYIAEFFNSISLSLFGGASTAFLINTFKTENPDGTIQNIIAVNLKFSRIGMIFGVIICGVVPFSSIYLLWIIAGILMFFLAFFGNMYLPGDKEVIAHTPDVNLKNSARLIFKLIADLRVLPIAVLCIIITTFFNIVVNFNQIALFTYTPYLNIPIYYSILFVIILAVQALAGKLSEKISLNSWLIAFLLILSLAFQIYMPDSGEIKLILFVLSYFLMMIILINTESRIQEVTPKNLRATTHSIFSTGSMVTASIVSIVTKITYQALHSVLFVLALIFVVPFLVKIVSLFWVARKNISTEP